MESDKQEQMEAWTVCQFMLGKWGYGERSFLRERHWINPDFITTPTQSFNGTTGSVEYQELLHGSHIYGEYRQEAEPSKSVMSILLQRTTNNVLEITIAAPDANRFCGPVRLSGPSMYLEGKAIPFFMADYLQDAFIPILPKPECQPITKQAVADARVAIHSLRPDRWLLVVYHRLKSSSKYPTFLKTEVWHFRSEPKDSLVVQENTREETHRQEVPSLSVDFTDLEAKLTEIKCELDDRQNEYYHGMKVAQTSLGSERTPYPKTEVDHVYRVTRRPPAVR